MKALRRCSKNLEADDVVLIDVDTYNFNNVIVIDVPENHTKKRGGSNDKSRSLRTYIYIDDDESPRNHRSERNFDNGASSSKTYGPDTHFAQENISPVKLSKGKRTYSGRCSNSHSGFSVQSDSDSSEDDGPDCEFMEDFSGKLREQWEKASLKRKADVHNGHCGIRDRYGASVSPVNFHNGFGLNKNKEKQPQVSKSKETSQSSSGNDNQQAATEVNHHEEQIPCAEMYDCGERGDLDVDCGSVNLPDVVETDDFGEHESMHIDEKDEQIPCTSGHEEIEKNDVVDGPTIDAASVENSIIDQREKLKETDEYKLALEQEMSARQIALKIQAEEAQQLRRLQKRKKAESLRLLDMERRQKQRVEEIREAQKKDEENMNLKEKYRMEVRQELKKLEITCLDMSSLLRGLGIQVGDGPCPLSHQVRAAYKRALLSFHPDRALGSDMRQKVEAEEKFKLISRMKEKLSL